MAIFEVQTPDGRILEIEAPDNIHQDDLAIAASSWLADQAKIKPEQDGSDVVRGATTALKQLPQLGYGLLAGAGAAGEYAFGEGGVSTGLKKFGVEGYKAAEADIQKDSKQSDSLSYSWEQAQQGNFGALADWLQYGIGYGGVQAVEALASAGIGAAIGKATLKGVAEKAKLTGSFLKRKMGEYQALKKEIDLLQSRLKK